MKDVDECLCPTCERPMTTATKPKRDRTLRAKLLVATEALDRIARSDYRGNPPEAYTIARQAQRDIVRAGR